MNIITKQQLIDMAAGRWYQQYYNSSYWLNGKQEIYNKLMALKEPTAEMINTIIGNGSWTRLQCDNCKEEVDKAIIMDVTNSEYTTYICGKCISEAHSLLRSE